MKVSKFLSLIIILPSLILTENAFAQEPDRQVKRNTEFNALYGIPLGNFGSTDINNGSFALPGWGFSINSISLYPSGFFTISSTSYSWNDIDDEALARGFVTIIGEDLVQDVRIEGGQHKPLFTLFGPGYALDLAGILTIDLAPQIGLLYNSFNEFDMYVEYADELNIPDVRDVVDYDSDFAFAYGLRTGVSLRIIKDVLYLTVSGSYSAANIKTKIKSREYGNYRSTEKMEYLNLEFGIKVFRH